MSEATPQEVRDEFIEELFKHAEIRSRAFENKIKKLLKSHEEKIVEMVLTIVEKHDPSTNRETNKAYWGNTLREELQTLRSKNE